MPIKIEALIGDTPRTFEYGNVFSREEVEGHPRLRIGVDQAQDAYVRALATDLSGPFQLLYVLHHDPNGCRTRQVREPGTDR